MAAGRDGSVHERPFCQEIRAGRPRHNAAVVRILHVQGHLHGVELEAVLTGDFERVKMDSRVLVSGKSDESQLADLPEVEKRNVRSVFVAMRYTRLVMDLCSAAPALLVLRPLLRRHHEREGGAEEFAEAVVAGR